MLTYLHTHTLTHLLSEASLGYSVSKGIPYHKIGKDSNKVLIASEVLASGEGILSFLNR